MDDHRRRIVRVLPDLPALSREFDYAVPPEMSPEVRVGSRVRVPLHGRRVGGWVVAEDVSPPGDVELRSISTLSGWGPPSAVIDLARWAAWRWAGSVATLLRAASPSSNVRSLPQLAQPGGANRPSPAADGEVRRSRSEADPLPELDAALGRIGPPTMYRLAPLTDPFALVEAIVERLGTPRSVWTTGTGEGRGSILVLAPNLGWAGRLVQRLARRGWPVVGARQAWAEAAAGWPIVVGSRAAAWAPCPRLRAAVVVDAHDEAYREERAPTYNAWEVVAERAARDRAPCLLTSPCPTVVQAVHCELVAPEATRRRESWPRVHVVDRRGADPRTGLFSEELVHLGRALLDGQATPDTPFVVVLDRVGRAQLLACAACGELARCEACGRAVQHVGAELRCRRCGRTRPVVCAHCGATRLKVLRPGVSRVRQEVEALLGVEVAEISGPARRRGGADAPDASLAPTRVLVGTGAVLHRVRQASSVVFLDFDQHLLAPRFAAAEEALALLVRAGRLLARAAAGDQPGGGTDVAGEPRPGRRSAGVVMVQTRLPGDPVLRAALMGDPEPLLAGELSVRRELRLPPISALALLSGPAAEAFADALKAGDRDGVTVSATVDGRWLVRAARHDLLCDALAATARPKGRLRIEVDPTDV